MSSTEKKVIEILQEKISFIPKELINKDEIIETLIKTETSIFESVLFLKPKNKFLNQIWTWNSSKSPPSLHSLNRMPGYKGGKKNSSQTNINIPKSKNVQSQTRNKK